MEEKGIRALLQEHNKIMEKLIEAKVIRGNNLVADYGEYLSAKMLGLTLMSNSVNRDYDAEDKDGKKYQIKSRKDSLRNKATILPIDRNIEQLKTANFDFLIGIVFDNDWNVKVLLKIPREELVPNKYGRIVINKRLIQTYGMPN